MPAHTRQAMLEGIGKTTIIVGGYSDGQGGICPMLAAHRNGGRTSFATFAHAWDRYTKADGVARTATERELQTLRSMLEASIEAEEVVGQGVLGRGGQAAPPLPGGPSPARGVRRRAGRARRWRAERQYTSPARTNCTSGT